MHLPMRNKEQPPPTLDEGIRRHLGLGLRVWYQKDAPILPNDHIDYVTDLMESDKAEILKIRDDILAHVGPLGEHPFAMHPVCTALAQLIHRYRIGAYQVLGKALSEFGRSIGTWGGWPRLRDIPCESVERLAHLIAITELPKSEGDWNQFFSLAGALVYGLMEQNEKNREFWDTLSQLSYGPLFRAVDAYRRLL